MDFPGFHPGPEACPERHPAEEVLRTLDGQETQDVRLGQSRGVLLVRFQEHLWGRCALGASDVEHPVAELPGAGPEPPERLVHCCQGEAVQRWAGCAREHREPAAEPCRLAADPFAA